MSVRFIDRAEELEALRRFTSEFRPVPLYIYGAEGCGKTRLLKEFVGRFCEYFGNDGVAIYVDAVESDSVGRALYTSHGAEIAVEIASAIVERFTGVGIGKALAENVVSLLEKVAARRRLEGRYVVLVVDDVVRAIGIERIEWYVKWLYESLWKLYEEYRPKAFNIVVTTSEGESLERVMRHRHAYIALLWSLDEEAYRKLLKELRPPPNLRFEDVWSLFAGNPAKLVELAHLYNWRLEAMMEDYRDRMRPVVREILNRGLRKELEMVLEDVDALFKEHNEKMLELEKILIQKNLVIYKKVKTLTEKYVKEEKELGIGEYFAWQVPAYRSIIRALLHEA